MSALATRKTFAVVAAVMTTLSCNDAARDHEVVSLRQQLADSGKAAREATKDAEAWHRIADEKYAYAEKERARADELQARVERVRDLIGQDIDRLSSSTEPAVPGGTARPTEPERQAPAYAASLMTESRPATKQASSWNDVSRASDFYDAPTIIEEHCRSEWPTNPEMFSFCGRKQSEAVNALKRGRPFGADETRWNEARVRCASEWPRDYSMRVYCELK